MANRETNVANFYETTLSVDMTATDTVATVATTVGAPTSPCILVIEPASSTNREVILFDGSFTSTTLATTAIGNRYLAGSAAASGLAHAAGSVVRASPLAQHFEDLNDRVDAVVSADSPLTLTAGAATEIPLSLVGAASQSANLQEWRDSAATVLTRVLSDGTVVAGNTALRVGANATGNLQTIYTQPAAADHRGLVIRGAASQTANLQEWQDSAGAVLASVGADGRLLASRSAAVIGNDPARGSSLYVESAVTSQPPLLVRGASGQTASFFVVEQSDGRDILVVDANGSTIVKANPTGTQASLYVDAAAADRVPLLVRAAASQTATLTEWRNSAGTEVLGVQSDGRLRYSSTHAVTTARTGGSAAALPAQPVEYIQIIVGSLSRWIPVYS